MPYDRKPVTKIMIEACQDCRQVGFVPEFEVYFEELVEAEGFIECEYCGQKLRPVDRQIAAFFEEFFENRQTLNALRQALAGSYVVRKAGYPVQLGGTVLSSGEQISAKQLRPGCLDDIGKEAGG